MTAARPLQPVPDLPADGEAFAAQRYDLTAEQAVLGAMMLNPDVIADTEAQLVARSFYRPIHGTIFEAITHLAAASRPTDPIAVSNQLAAAGKLAQVGGGPYLHTLIEAVPVVAQVGHYAAIVAGLARLRRLDQIVAAARQMVTDAAHDRADEVTEKLIDMLVDTGAAASTDGGPKPWSEMIPELLDELEELGKPVAERAVNTIVPTGWEDMDRLFGGGLKPGQLVIVAGRPGAGKSTAAMNVVTNATLQAVERRVSTAVFSLEMGQVELGMRLTSAACRIPFHDLQAGNLSAEDWQRIATWTGETADAPLYVDDTANLTVADIRARARRVKQRHGLGLIVVDYVQLITPGRAESRQVAVGAMSRSLKLLAKELQVPLILVAQLNRGPEQRADRRPVASDLRESGSLEADADIVWLVHRDDQHDKESPRAGEADFIIDKHRGGPTDTITVAAQLHLSRFVDLAVM